MDGGLNNALADELAELLDIIRLDNITEDDRLTKWLQCRGYKKPSDAIASLVTALPKGTQVCLK